MRVERQKAERLCKAIQDYIGTYPFVSSVLTTISRFLGRIDSR